MKLRPFRDVSIRRKLTRITMLASFTALTSASGAFAVYDILTFRDALVRRLATVAEVVGSNSVSALLFNDTSTAVATLRALQAEPSVMVAGVYGADGRLFATFAREEGARRHLALRIGPAPEASHRFEPAHVIIVEPIVFQGQPVGTVLIRSDLNEIKQRMQRYGGIVLLVSLAAFLVSLAISYRLQRSISRPLLELADTARRVSVDRDYSVRARSYGRDEIGLLIETFNDMLAQIQDRDETMSRVAMENARLYMDAEAASRMKDEFLATLSHELRTPLNAIVGWTQLLKAGQLDAASRDRAIAVIDRNATAQSHLIQDILDVSRIISGRIHLDLRPVSPSAVIGTVLDSLRPTAEAKGVELETALEHDPAFVLADADRLQQVIWNLLSNAIKFTPAGGRIEVRIERREADFEIAVRDTGIGIDPEFLPHVFERFSQADPSTTRVHGGLGLGLAIVRHLVELHGGTVAVESEGRGRGSTFRVRLPARTPGAPGLEARPDAAAAAPLETRLEGIHVLVVDDERDSLDLMRTVLERSGARVTAAESGAEALESLARDRPDVLLSDIGMPRMDGYALIKLVRARSAIPAAAVTAYARSSDRDAALAAGFDVHLSKPIVPEQLVGLVLTLAGRRASA